MANTLTKRPPTIPQPTDAEALPSRRRWILVLVVAGLALATSVLVAQVVDRTTFDDPYVTAEQNRMLAVRDASVSHVSDDPYVTAEQNRFETAQEIQTPAP